MNITSSQQPLIYEGVAFRQAPAKDSPWLVTFVASAEQLLTWAGIPRRADGENLTGFQRTADPTRVEKARQFFMKEQNQSPTALIVGIHPTPEGVEPSVRLEFLDSDEDSAAYRRCRLTVTFDESALDTAELSTLIRSQINYRLQGDSSENGDDGAGGQSDSVLSLSTSAPSGDQSESDVAEGEIEDEAIMALEETDSSDAEDNGAIGSHDDIELGRSLLQQLNASLNNIDWCEENREALLDIAKPATVIDGQHRVLGAALCERDIPFSVCALFGSDWAEQVFQFTVVNYTQRGIPDQFITANAALSLTKAELDSLQPRLEQAGVKVVEYELMRVVTFDPASPFHDLVNLSESKDKSKIGYKTMVRIAKMWYATQHPAFKLVLPNLYPQVRGRHANSVRLARWKDEDWGDFFLDFWRQVHDRYADHPSHVEGHTLWDVGASNLMVAIVLLELQQAFLLNVAAQDEEFFEVSGENPKEELRRKLRKRAEKFLDWIPIGFFAHKWGTKSLNTGAGRDMLETAFRSLVQSKGSFHYEKSNLVTGKAS